MLKTSIFLLYLAGLVLSVAGNRITPQHVLEFGDTNIEAALSAAKFSLIYFYMDNCRYCGAFEPTFDYLSVLYNTDDTSKANFQVLKTNGKKHERLGRLFGIRLFPTLKLLNFDTKQIITYDQKLRDLQSVIEFVEKHVPGALPDYERFQSLVHYYKEGDEIGPESVLVFVAAHLHEWTQYKFPGHFIQQISREIPPSGPKLVLVDVDKLASYGLLSRFLVSNFPSLVYVGEGVKTYKTLPQHYSVSDQLDERDIRQFLGHLQSHEYGPRYESESALRKAVQNSEISEKAHQHSPARGFVRLQNAHITTASLDEEFARIVDHIEL